MDTLDDLARLSDADLLAGMQEADGDPVAGASPDV
jgi:hypothetical protein